MALQARNLILTRRTAAIADLSGMTITEGTISVDAAEGEGIFRINCSHQVGIATQNEVGLTAARYPIRVVLSDPRVKFSSPECETVCHYWAIKHADWTAVPYSRKPNVSTTVIKNLYGSTGDFDALLWGAYKTIKDTKGKSKILSEWGSNIDQLYALTSLLNPNTDQMQEIGDLVSALITDSVVKNNHAYFKVGDNAYLVAVPHGKNYTANQGVQPQKIAVYESALTLKVNYDRLKARYETLSDGVVTMAANCIMMMFRHGIAESYESTEYYTVSVTAGADNKFTVDEIYEPPGAGAMEGLRKGDIIDISALKFSKQVIQVANLLVMTAGLMHYLFNHTTGGTVVSGTLLTTLAMFSLVTAHTHIEEQTDITSLMYEALHPVNKRAVANLFFDKSQVVTHGRPNVFRKYEQFETDAFFAIRANPFPAGSHKAFVCLSALRRVLQAGLGPFLPWADQLNSCINLCKDVLTNGARSHIGSAYYTGDPPLVQPSSLDQYLPELATYLHTFNKGDSLTMSPHMSIDIANRAAMNWQGLMKDLKAKDISSTPAEVVRNFLSTTGAVNFTFDPTDDSTWAKAAEDAAVAQKAIAAVFG